MHAFAEIILSNSAAAQTATATAQNSKRVLRAFRSKALWLYTLWFTPTYAEANWIDLHPVIILYTQAKHVSHIFVQNDSNLLFLHASNALSQFGLCPHDAWEDKVSYDIRPS